MSYCVRGISICLDHRRAREVGEATKRVEVDAFRIEDGRHLLYVTFAGA